MRHYEIMLLIHPDRSDQIASMVERYTQLITAASGVVHRIENLGRRNLAYPIAKLNKAYYIILNAECSLETEQELKSSVSFDDAVIRVLSIRQNQAITEPSVLSPDFGKNSESTASSESTDMPKKGAENSKKQKYRTLSEVKDTEIEYKNADFLASYLTDTKKIARRRVAGGNAKQQHRLSQAIKRARFVGLLPHCDKYIQPEIS